MRASQRNRERDDVDPCVSVPNIQGPLYKEGEREWWSGEGLRSRLQIWGMEGRNAYEEGNSTRSSHTIGVVQSHTVSGAIDESDQVSSHLVCIWSSRDL